MSKELISLVAGSAGFIGSHLSESLLQSGHQVIGVDNLITGLTENIEYLSSKYPSFMFIEHDIKKPLKLKNKLNYIFDFACPASPTDFEKLRMEILHAGCFGVYHLLQLSKQHRALFTFSSSSEVYGDALVNPQPETYNGNVNTTGIRSIYDESKRFSESMITVFRREFGIRTRIVRIFNTYGERMKRNDGRAIPTFINQALRGDNITIFGDGLQTRSIQYITDLIRGIRLLADSNISEPINIGNPIEMTIKELAEKIISLTESKSKIIYKRLPEHDPKVRRPDITKAKKLLGWEPQVSPEEGLLKTINWFKSRS